MGAYTSHHMVLEPSCSRFLEEVAARQMVEVDVHNNRLRTLQNDEQTNDDDDQMSSQTWSRRVLKESKQRRSKDARGRLCWTKHWMNRSIEEECRSKVQADGDKRGHVVCAVLCVWSSMMSGS